MITTENGVAMAQQNGAPAMALDDLRREDPKEVFIVSLTPEQCRRIVKNSIAGDVNFRKLADDTRLAAMVDAMKRGRWDWRDADPLRLHVDKASDEIVTSDGQHRLQAAVLARRNLRALVLWGDEWKAGVHVDRNKMRNVAQFLGHEYGLKGAAIYVAVARLHLARVTAYQNRTSTNYSLIMLDDESIIEHVVENMNELQWAIGKAGTGGSRGFNVTAYAAFLYELLKISHETATHYHDDMKDPELDSIDPLAQLRRVVGRRYSETGRRAHRDYSMSNLVKAHNLRSTGQTLTKWVTASNDEVFFPAGLKIEKKQKQE